MLKKMILRTFVFVVVGLIVAPLCAMKKEDPKVAAVELVVQKIQSSVEDRVDAMLLGKLEQISQRATEVGKQLVSVREQKILLQQGNQALLKERNVLLEELDYQQKIFVIENQVLRTNLQQKNEIISAVSACVPFAMGDTPISGVKMRLNRVDTLRVSEEYYKELLEEWQRFGIFVEKGKDIPVLHVQSVFYVDKKKNDWVRNWRSLPPFFLQDIITAQNKLGLLAREKIYQGLDEFKFPGWVPAEIVDGKNKIKLSVLGVPFECEVVFEDKNLLKSKSTFWRPIALTFLGTSCAWIIGLLIYKCNADPMFFPILIEQLRSVI